MRSIITTLQAGVFCLASLAPMTLHAQEATWTGGDGAPTNPLACDSAKPAVDPGAYNGASPATTVDRKGKPIKVVDVPKLVGIGYFMSSAAGAQLAAKEIGSVQVTTDGPTKANIDEQITFIDNYVTSGIDGIMLSANDPVAVAPVLKKALESGINVVTYDADAEPDARQWFINPATANGVAKTLIDQLAEQIGQDGHFAIVTSTFTTPNQARWISEMAAYSAKCYPKMKFLETVEAQEDNILSFNQAQTLINKYGDELKGIVGMTSVATPAASEAVQQSNLCGKVSVVGLALPNAMKPYVNSGCVKSAVLWSTEDMGYAAATALRAIADGTLKPGDKTFKAGKLGDLQIINKSEILLGAPKVFTKDNIASFDF